MGKKSSVHYVDSTKTKTPERTITARYFLFEVATYTLFFFSGKEVETPSLCIKTTHNPIPYLGGGDDIVTWKSGSTFLII